MFQNCETKLCVEDFKQLNSETMAKMQKNALDHKLVDRNCSLKPCPSPNCSGVFRKISTLEGENENESFYCTFCGVNICRRCECVYHTGMTCQFYQIYKTDNDHSLRVGQNKYILSCLCLYIMMLIQAWLLESPDTRKLCPTCQSPIEKNGGCLHIHCIKYVYFIQ